MTNLAYKNNQKPEENTFTASIESPFCEKPEPLGQSRVKLLPYPKEALGDLLGEMTVMLNQKIKAPIGLCGQSVLMTSALVAQGLRNIELDDRTIPLSLFALTIGLSGERKSTVDNIAFSPIEAWEKEKLKIFEDDKKDFNLKVEAFKLQNTNLQKSLKSETDITVIEQTLSAANEPPTRPIYPKCRMVDATIEGLQKQLKSSIPVAGIYTDEGAIFFSGHSMSPEKKAKTIGLYSKLWDGSDIDMIRSSAEVQNFTLNNRRVSMHLMIQPVIAEDIFRDSLLIHQGFLARFLVSYPESTMGTRSYQPSEIKQETAFKTFSARIKSLLDKGFDINEDGSLNLPTIKISANAKDKWILFHDEIESKLSRYGELRHISGTAAKIAEQALRIAGVLTVINSKNQADSIHENEMNSAIKLAKYSLNQFINIIEQSSEEKQIKSARLLLNWIAENKFDYLYSSLMANKRPNQIRPKEAYQDAVKTLEKNGYLFKMDEPIELDNRTRKEVYKVIHYSEPN